MRVAVFLQACVMSGLVVCGPAGAAITLDGNRVIMTEAEGRASMRVQNTGETPLMLQVWIDNGDMAALPEQIITPLAVTPPLFRLDAGKDKSLLMRVARKDMLPKDRESMYRLNILEVPTKVVGEEAVLQINSRSRVKLFYRPTGLKKSAEQAPMALTWRWAQADGKRVLHVNNPTPWHVNLNELTLPSQAAPLDVGDGVIPPFNDKQYPVPADMTASEFTYTWINDYGVVVEQRASIIP